MTGSSFQHSKRGAMTPQRVLYVFQSCGGRCAKCGRKLTARDDYHIDHIIALENGGTDDDDNLQVLCDWCHTPKTADDHAQAGHGRRMAVKAHVPGRYKQKWWKGRWR